MNCRLLISAGTMLGIGLGGFLDGIVFHQLLQIHNMLSAKTPMINLVNAEINMFWDGIFHLFTWSSTAAGLWMLWRAGAMRDVSWSGRVLLGAMLFGWGLFNFVEGLLDHHILHLHHVIERLGLSIFDYAFLASGVVLMVLGGTLIWTGKAYEFADRRYRLQH